MTCRICGQAWDDGRVFRAREMLFGTREPFDYVQCAGCQTIQITEVAAELGKYYPESYHEFTSFKGSSLPGFVGTMMGGPAMELREVMVRMRHEPKEVVEHWLAERFVSFYLADLDLPSDARILDVGCADGSLLRA